MRLRSCRFVSWSDHCLVTLLCLLSEILVHTVSSIIEVIISVFESIV